MMQKTLMSTYVSMCMIWVCFRPWSLLVCITSSQVRHVQFDSDQEAALEEEEEALRLQKQQAQKLTGNEFGIPDADDSDSDGDEDEGAPESGALGRAAQV